jgi:hypothetical protein
MMYIRLVVALYVPLQICVSQTSVLSTKKNSNVV